MAASKSDISAYRRALTKAAHAQAEYAAAKNKVIREGCTHPTEFVQKWTTTIYQVGSFVEIGQMCSICDARIPKFGQGWKSKETAEFDNQRNCPHPEEWHRSYSWHHGYGKYINGIECAFCCARKSFPEQGYWDSYEKWSQWKRDRDDD